MAQEIDYEALPPNAGLPVRVPYACQQVTYIFVFTLLG
jgi:hypothetical protein